ncbi:MAG: TPM domain-containing protein [Pseudoflavonifractor sp.]|nr:TPM domain-containing protein [Alloprevotella sp.]MCM1116117.1 TPM domain-containing protein [Pseudoflavonifractor sp.]
MTRHLLHLLLFLILTLPAMAAGRSVDEIPNVHVADRTRYVSNPDGVLSPEAEAKLNQMLAQAWEQSSAEIAVVAVADIDTPDDIDGFATDLFEEWGIGKEDNDNGVLILIARDSRHAVIRTGQGMEGPLPDIIAGRILRNVMFPRFKEGDYDGGIIAATGEVVKVATDPKYAEELRSRHANDSRARQSDFDSDAFFSWYVKMSLVVGGALLLIVLLAGRNKDPQKAYIALEKLRLPALFFTVLCLGAPVIGLIILLWRMNRIRKRPRLCPNCNHKMHRLDEEADNAYLTPSQDAEERLNSIDYDVWLCPQCGETDIIPYVNKAKQYTVCDHCGARAMALAGNRTLVRPTERSEGRGVRSYLCHACGHRKDIPYTIAKVATPPIVIIPGRGFGGGGGGGFSGGSFGGGSTMGGGASGSW